jgi:hypothetical protein
MLVDKNLKFLTISSILTILLFYTGCVDSIDEPEIPSRGFFMGILPKSCR